MSKPIPADERAQWRQAFAPLSDTKSLIIGRLLDALEQAERDRDTYRAAALHATETAREQAQVLACNGAQVPRTDTAGQGEGDK